MSHGLSPREMSHRPEPGVPERITRRRLHRYRIR
jgi:hypothetical protein